MGKYIIIGHSWTYKCWMVHIKNGFLNWMNVIYDFLHVLKYCNAKCGSRNSIPVKFPNSTAKLQTWTSAAIFSSINNLSLYTNIFRLLIIYRVTRLYYVFNKAHFTSSCFSIVWRLFSFSPTSSTLKSRKIEYDAGWKRSITRWTTGCEAHNLVRDLFD